MVNTTPEYLVELGLSKKTAKFLIKRFGDSLLKILKESPSKLSKFLGSKELYTARAEHAKRTYAKDFFALLDCLHADAVSVLNGYELLGEDACERFKDNPYSVCEAINFDKIDEYATGNGIERLAPERVQAAILEVLRNCKYQRSKDFADLNGGMYCPQAKLFEHVSKLLKEDDMDSYSFSNAINKLYMAKKIHVTRIGSGDMAVYPRELAEIEFNTANIIARKLKKTLPPIENISRLIEKAQAELDILLSDEQSAAVKMALSSPLSVITGGPGTGKTSVQRVLIETFEWATKCRPVRLNAPTGQASKRMTESTGYPATTIHKSLNLLAGELDVADEVLLDEGLIIIDEASMIDAELFHLLISSISDESRIVVVGDINQLPSIGVGAVLRELIAAESVPFTMLTKVFRQADDSPIAYNAARIKTGEQIFIENDSFQFRESGATDTLAELVSKSYLEAVNEVGLDNVICLTAFRKRTDTGVNELNPVLRSLVRDDIKGDTVYAICNDRRYYKGDKIIYGKNKNGLVNGDLGIIKEVLGIKSVICQFGDIEVTLKGSELEALDLAYVQTVHKSQGAEFKTVVMICDERHDILLQKELVYTAITRAKNKLICCCDKKQTVLDACQRPVPARNSLLSKIIDSKSLQYRENCLTEK